MKLSRTTTGLLAVALMSFMVSDVMAQGRRPGGGQPGGGRGGPGGFGQRGGPGGGGFGGRGGPGGPGQASLNATMFRVLRVDEVKLELELLPDQEEAIGKLMEQSEQERGERPNVNFREMSEEERSEAFAKMREQFENARQEREKRLEEMSEQLEQVLLPQQMGRLTEIAIREMGLGALSDKTVAADLKISDAQQKELEEVREQIGQDMRSKMQELFRSGDRDAMREAFAKMRETSEQKVLAVLSSDQREKFEEMKGEDFEMPEGNRGGFGGRGGPGGGRGPGGDDGGRRRGRPPVEE